MLFSGVAAHAPTDKFVLHGSEGSLSYDFATDEVFLGKRGETPTFGADPAEMQRDVDRRAGFHRRRARSSPRRGPGRISPKASATCAW